LRHALPPGWKRVSLAEVVRPLNARVKAEPEKKYKMAGVKWYGEGVFHRETVRGGGMSAKYVTPLVSGALIYNRLFAWKASFAVVPPELADCFVSNEFPQFMPDAKSVLPEYVYLFSIQDSTIRAINAASTGSSAVSRKRFKEEDFLDLEILLPPLREQVAIVGRWREAQTEIAAVRTRVEKKRAEIDECFLAGLGLPAEIQTATPKCFGVRWKHVEKWGVQQIFQFGRRAGRKAKYTEALISELCDISSGGTPPRNRKNYFGGSIPWVKTTEVRNNEITSTEETLTEEGLVHSSAKIYPKGSLIVAMYGQGATRGRTAKLGIDAATNQACAVLSKVKSAIDTDFLWFFLMSQYAAMRVLASGNNQPNLNAKMIANLRVPLPPIRLQREMAARMKTGRTEIARECAKTARYKTEAKDEVDALMMGIKKLSMR
jgi:restriction endonuclease S subunit